MIGKILYGFLFVVALPLGLVAWGTATADLVLLPVPSLPGTGLGVAIGGAALLIAGMTALRTHGGGLPMNAYPPPHFVTQGVYAWVSQPIYIGFTLICGGLSVYWRSSSGFWLVTPAVAAGCTALVLGYEQHDLRRRFGPQETRPVVALAPADSERPSFSRRISALVLVFGTWLLAYELTILIGVPAGAFEIFLPFERSWPVLEWTEVIYASAYLVVPLPIFVLPSNELLRRFSVNGLLAIAATSLCFWTLPAIAPPRPFEITSFWGELLELEREFDLHTGAAAFPSFHAMWAFLSAHFLGAVHPRLRTLLWVWALAVAISCMTTGMHALLDVIAGGIVALAAISSVRIWSSIRRGTERIANSWREWRVGPLRIINHGAYGGLGAFIGIAMAAWLIGPDHLGSLWIIGVTAMVTAGFWAQIVEGESVSLRPFGYYGSVLGAALGGAIVWAMGGSLLACLAALAAAAPWVQSCGRCRCLVQGCCHGYETDPRIGVRFHHPRSRVVRLSTLGGKAIHPTQTYSILFNIVSGVVLLRVWSLELPFTFVIGLYLMLAGLGRFAEESFRGEPQTPVIRGLAVYQWNAIVSLVLGMVLTCLDGPRSEFPPASLADAQTLSSALGFGLLIWVLMGVDFPNSDRRFARLTK